MVGHLIAVRMVVGENILEVFLAVRSVVGGNILEVFFTVRTVVGANILEGFGILGATGRRCSAEGTDAAPRTRDGRTMEPASLGQRKQKKSNRFAIRFFCL